MRKKLRGNRCEDTTDTGVPGKKLKCVTSRSFEEFGWKTKCGIPEYKKFTLQVQWQEDIV